jgi:thioredoxin 1
MVERLVLALVLGLLSTGAFTLFRHDHLRRASKLAPATGKPLLLYFRSDTCAPCVAQGHYVRQLQAEYGDRFLIRKVDVEAEQAITERYGVFTLPTTLIVDSSGAVKHANYGLTDAVKLASQLFAHDPGAA